MTLSFTQTIDDLPNYFLEKIWRSIKENYSLDPLEYEWYVAAHKRQFGIEWRGAPWFEEGKFHGGSYVKPKLHTIRGNRHSKWRAGMDIHFVINNRQPSRFQFAPVVKCISCQEIWILKFNDDLFGVKVDGRNLLESEVEDLVINDGFDSVEDFYKYFLTNSPFGQNYYGKIIHWTNKRY